MECFYFFVWPQNMLTLIESGEIMVLALNYVSHLWYKSNFITILHGFYPVENGILFIVIHFWADFFS
jgi:hypothetical protein